MGKDESVVPTVAKTCFVIAPIGEADSEIRQWSDQLLRHVIAKAVERRGYRAYRADRLGKPGVITHQVIERIIDDPLVIADLTFGNPNVFYELALRHIVNKPFIQLVRHGEEIPFDNRGMRAIVVNLSDPDAIEHAQDEIVAQIDGMQAEGSIPTPVSGVLDWQALRHSDNPLQRTLAEMSYGIAEIRAAMGTRIPPLSPMGKLRPGETDAFVKRDRLNQFVRDWRRFMLFVSQLNMEAEFKTRILDLHDSLSHMCEGIVLGVVAYAEMAEYSLALRKSLGDEGTGLDQ